MPLHSETVGGHGGAQKEHMLPMLDRTDSSACHVSLVRFLDPGRVPKRYDVVVWVGVLVTVFEKCLRLC